MTPDLAARVRIERANFSRRGHVHYAVANHGRGLEARAFERVHPLKLQVLCVACVDLRESAVAIPHGCSVVSRPFAGFGMKHGINRLRFRRFGFECEWSNGSARKAA